VRDTARGENKPPGFGLGMGAHAAAADEIEERAAGGLVEAAE
jgi:hypothetical protein